MKSSFWVTLALLWASPMLARPADQTLTLLLDFDRPPMQAVRLAILEDGAPPASSNEPIEHRLGARWLVTYDDTGAERSIYEVPSRSTSFHDFGDPTHFDSAGGLAKGRNLHLVHLPYEDDLQGVAFIDLAPMDSHGDPPRHHLTAGFSLRPRGTSDGPSLLSLRPPEDSVSAAPLQIGLPHESDLLRLVPPLPGLEVVRLAGEREPPKAFDIVLLGDGFTSTELPGFEARMRRLVRKLFEIEPFKSERDAISIHLVKTASNESGVTFCPCCDTERDTFFGVRGNFTRSKQPTDYDTDEATKLLRAVAAVGSSHEIEATLVFVNCSTYGARAFRDRRLAYVSAVPSTEELARLVAHELAHVVADLGDEYLSCDVERDVSRRFLNIATPTQLKAGQVPWIHLAKASEIDADGQLIAGERCGVPTEGPENTLGLFWGAQFIAMSAAPCSCTLHDARLCGYFRPMKSCLMRSIGQPFCRVCEHTLRQAIRQPSAGVNLAQRAAGG